MAKILLITNPEDNLSNHDLKQWAINNPTQTLDIIACAGEKVAEVVQQYPHTEILVCSYGNYTAEALQKLPNLTAIITTTTATEFLDIDYCEKKGIAVYNNIGYSGTAVAEHLLALLLAVARKLLVISKETITEPPDKLLGFELMHKTVGILGYGHIGKTFARMASALGMKVLLYTRTKQHNVDIEQLALEQLLPRAEILVVTLPLNAQTTLLLDKKRLALLPRGAVIVSASPEDIFDLDAIYAMLKSGALGGAGLDLHGEHPEAYKVANFIATRIKGVQTKECIKRRTLSFLANLDKLLIKEAI